MSTPDSQNSNASEKHLISLDYRYKFLARGFFVGRLSVALYRHESLYALMLIALVGTVYFLSRRSVWDELAIVKTLFPRDQARIPDTLKLKDRRAINLEVTGFMALYLFLGVAAQCILVASFCMFVIACIDFNTRRLINKHMRQYFADVKYAPHREEADYADIMNRRGVAAWFLFDLPHLWKEAARAIGYAAAVVSAIYAQYSNAHNMTLTGYFKDVFYCVIFGNAHGMPPFEHVAYIILLATLVLNELVTWWWRRKRDNRLRVGRL
jgi:hypothetical protein